METRLHQLTAAAALFTAAVGGAARGQCVDSLRLPISDAAANDGAGRALMMAPSSSGPRLITGIPFDNTAFGNDAGSAWIHGRLSNGSWSVQTHLYASDPAPGDHFGASVAVSDLYAIVGAPGAGDGGAAYFFERSGAQWGQMSRFAPPSTWAGDVGRSVAIDGTWAVIGTPGYDLDQQAQPANDVGAAYIARRQANGEWTVGTVLTRRTLPEDPVAGDRYGWAVAAADGVIVVGAPYGELAGQPSNCGHAVVWRHDGEDFVAAQVVHAGVPQEGEHAGWAVATDGQFVALGAPYNDRTINQGGALTDSGCVYVRRYEDGQWYTDGVVRASDASSSALFGSSVAMHSGRLIVAAEGANKVYVFRRTGPFGWVQEAVLTDPENAADGLFGSGVAFDGTYVAAGDAGDDFGGQHSNAGAVYVFGAPGFGQADTCAGAIPIGAGQYGGCTTYATRQTLATCGGVFQGPDAWHSFTPACSGTAIVHTAGSDYDTVLSVHHSCPDPSGDSHTIACNDNAGGLLGNISWLTFDYEAGATYYIRVSGASNASGNYTLELIDGNPPANDSCVAAQPITDGMHTFGTCRATGGFPAANGCSAQGLIIGNDVWFRYTAPMSGMATVDLCGSNFDTAAAAYAGTVCPTQPGTAIACSDDDAACPAGRSRLAFEVAQGQDYLIRVGASGVGTGTVVMDLSTRSPAPECPADWNADGAVNSSDISAFLTSWLASVNAGGLDADFNGDQETNSGDVSAFLTAWLAAVNGAC